MCAIPTAVRAWKVTFMVCSVGLARSWPSQRNSLLLFGESGQHDDRCGSWPCQNARACGTHRMIFFSQHQCRCERLQDNTETAAPVEHDSPPWLGTPPSWSTPGPDDKWRTGRLCLQLYLEQPIKGRRMAASGVSTDVGCKELPIGSATEKGRVSSPIWKGATPCRYRRLGHS